MLACAALAACAAAAHASSAGADDAGFPGARAAAAAFPGARAAAAPPVPSIQAPARTWPPREGRGSLFIHFGEEHLTDPDGPIVFPRVVAEARAWKPNLVLASGDKSDEGTLEKLTDYRTVMQPLLDAGIPWFGSVGNHDRETPVLPGGLSPLADLGPYKQVFAPMPYPFGDGAPPADPLFAPRARPADDPAGASSVYALDYANVRVIFIDNSCQSISNCRGPLENPPVADQYAVLREKAAEARAAGRKVWVVMHQPTRDPRDQSKVEPTTFNHNMGKGSSPDNQLFEQVAAQAGVEMVFLGHIKGQFEYSGQGGVRYFIDGGAGGELYTDDPEYVGVDTGYWYGYRLIRVDGGSVTTDTVPVLDSIALEGPDQVVERRERVVYSATGRQPATNGIKVDALELRDPDRSRADGPSLPTPSRIWTTSNPEVLSPKPATGDDPRRDPRTQTKFGEFRARCPGRATITVTSGLTSAEKTTTVTGGGPALRRVVARATTVRRGRPTAIASIKLGRPAQIEARVRRGRRVVATVLPNTCANGTRAVRWDAKGAKPGRYTLEIRVRSDRPTVVRKLGFSVR